MDYGTLNSYRANITLTMSICQLSEDDVSFDLSKINTLTELRAANQEVNTMYYEMLGI